MSRECNDNLVATVYARGLRYTAVSVQYHVFLEFSSTKSYFFIKI